MHGNLLHTVKEANSINLHLSTTLTAFYLELITVIHPIIVACID